MVSLFTVTLLSLLFATNDVAYHLFQNGGLETLLFARFKITDKTLQYFGLCKGIMKMSLLETRKT